MRRCIPPGAFDGDLAAIKTAALNGQLGTVDARQRAARLTREANNPALKAAMMAAARVPGVGILAALIATTALRAIRRRGGRDGDLGA